MSNVTVNPSDTPRADLTGVPDYAGLNGKSIIITGGASGLGRAVATKYARSGAYVTIGDLSEDEGHNLVTTLTGEGHHVQFIPTNVLDYGSQLQLFKSAVNFSPGKIIDIVIPFAGVAGGVFDDGQPEVASLEVDPPIPSSRTAPQINLEGQFYTAYLALYYFRLPPSQDDHQSLKSLVLISSLAGYIDHPLPGFVGYSASKWGVRGLWRGLRTDAWERYGIRSNLVAPWFVATPMTDPIAEIVNQRGLGWGKIEDVVDAVTFCAVNKNISQRAIGVTPMGPIDLRDDTEGLDGGEELRNISAAFTASE